MRSMATRQLISLSRPSSRLQLSSAQTSRDNSAREAAGLAAISSPDLVELRVC
jgi:hypothetical protein